MNKIIIFLIVIIFLCLSYILFVKKECFDINIEKSNSNSSSQSPTKSSLDDVSYKIYWDDIKDKGNDIPSNFYYEYTVWGGSNPTLKSTSPGYLQKGRTNQSYFYLDKSLFDQSNITVIITSNNSFGSSNETLKVFALLRVPSIKSVEFDSSSFKNSLLTSNAIVNTELSPNSSVSKDTIQIIPSLESVKGTEKNVFKSSKECSPIANNKAQCFFDIPSSNLYGGTTYTATIIAKNRIGESKPVSSHPFVQPELKPLNVISQDIKIDDIFANNNDNVIDGINILITFRDNGKILYLTKNLTLSSQKEQAGTFQRLKNGSIIAKDSGEFVINNNDKLALGTTQSSTQSSTRWIFSPDGSWYDSNISDNADADALCVGKDLTLKRSYCSGNYWYPIIL